MERVRRIELPSLPWQGNVLPLNHTRKPNNDTNSRYLSQPSLQNKKAEYEAELPRTVSGLYALIGWKFGEGVNLAKVINIVL